MADKTEHGDIWQHLNTSQKFESFSVQHLVPSSRTFRSLATCKT